MGRKWPLKPVDNGPSSRDKGEGAVAPFRGSLSEVEYGGAMRTDYGIYDTFIVSFSRYSEFKRLMHDKPFDERSKIVARVYMGHNTVYYADMNGFISKYQIEDENE
jgi:hypothetical protein